MDSDLTSTSDSDLEDLLAGLGLSMLAAGYSVTHVATTLHQVALTAGRERMSIGVLPDGVFVDGAASGKTRFGQSDQAPYRFDQTQRVGVIAGEAMAGRRSPPELLADLRRVPDMAWPYPSWLLAPGNGLVAAGISAVFGTTWAAVGIDLVVGIAVGVVLVLAARLPQLTGVLPFFVGVFSAAAVLGIADVVGLEQVSLYATLAPTVALVPGAMITNAVVELANGDVVSGGGRFVAGMLTWLMLLLGLFLGARLMGFDPNAVAMQHDAGLPTWAVWLGLLLLAVGIGLSQGAYPRLLVAVVVVVLATYIVLVAVEGVANRMVASGVAAAVMFVVTGLVEERFPQWPQIVTFRPAFWLLVPGSLGLATLAELAGSGRSATQTLVFIVFGTIISISLGIQIGAVVSRAIPGTLPRRAVPPPEA